MSRVLVKFFTGAPDARLLDFADSHLSCALLPAFRPERAEDGSHDISSVSDPSFIVDANWRLLGPESQLKGPGRSNDDVPSRTNASSLKSTLPDNEDDFIDQSIAVLEGLDSSQITPRDPPQYQRASDASTVDETLESTLISLSGSPYNATPTPAPKRAPPPLRGPIADLKTIPSAPHLLHLRPQTMTVNLIAGVISISAARTVHVRRGNYDMDIVELMLGDETRAGFSVTAWLTPILESQPVGKVPGTRARAAQVDDLRTQLEALRSGDVVYLSPLALTVFDGAVYGQTLNRRASGIRTRVEKILSAGAGGEIDPSLAADVRAKIERVRGWVDNFVGIARAPTTKGGAQKRSRSGGAVMETRRSKRVAGDCFLPPDSQ